MTSPGREGASGVAPFYLLLSPGIPAAPLLHELGEAGLARRFEEYLTVSTEITPERYRARSRRVRIKESVSRLFSPLG